MSNILHDQTAPAITCPDWCQSKPHDNPDGSYDGPHTLAAIPALDGLEDHKDDNGCSSALISVDLDDEHGAVIYLDAPHLTMTPDQSRAFTLGLFRVWAWAEDQTSA